MMGPDEMIAYTALNRIRELTPPENPAALFASRNARFNYGALDEHYTGKAGKDMPAIEETPIKYNKLEQAAKALYN